MIHVKYILIHYFFSCSIFTSLTKYLNVKQVIALVHLLFQKCVLQKRTALEMFDPMLDKPALPIMDEFLYLKHCFL